MEIQIIDYSAENKAAIKTLNIEWLEKYFEVEPIDTLQLSDPELEIIAKGGSIYYAKSNDLIVGTATLLKIDATSYELGKMAVTESYQGFGIGQKLLVHCIAEAKKLGAKKIILYSNTVLSTALNLYRKHGFIEDDLDKAHYKRANIKMKLELK